MAVWCAVGSGEGLVESFDSAVGPGPVGAGEVLGSVEVGQGLPSMPHEGLLAES